jgi:hypothetical protein
MPFRGRPHHPPRVVVHADEVGTGGYRREVTIGDEIQRAGDGLVPLPDVVRIRTPLQRVEIPAIDIAVREPRRFLVFR